MPSVLPKLRPSLNILRYQATSTRFRFERKFPLARRSCSYLHHPDASRPSSPLDRFTMTNLVSSSDPTHEQPWYAAYPKARSEPESVSHTQVLDMLTQSTAGEKFVLVDLRRTDYEVRSRD